MVVLLIILGLFFGYLIVDFIVGVFFYKTNTVFVRLAGAHRGRYDPVEKDGITTFITDGDFKILSIADTHIGAGILSGNEDRYALGTVARLVRRSRPDLVVVAGDIIYTTKLQTFNNDNIKAMKLIADLFEKMQIYWAPIFGNHDAEDADFTREQLGDFLESDNYKYCLFKKGSAIADGVGNYLINIENGEGRITRTLYFLDTNDYIEKCDRYSKDDTKYDNVHVNQIAWYENAVTAQNAKNAAVGAPPPKSIMFIHIPMPQYKTALAKGNIIYGKRRENICPGRDYGLFDKIVELGSTDAVYCGHDHTNDYAVEYKGVRLSYCMSIDYIAYVWTKFYNPARGGTIIQLSGGEYSAVRMRSSGLLHGENKRENTENSLENA